MKKKIFWRIFALSALSVLLVFLSALYAVNRNSQHVVEERLIAESELLSCVLKPAGLYRSGPVPHHGH